MELSCSHGLLLLLLLTDRERESVGKQYSILSDKERCYSCWKTSVPRIIPNRFSPLPDALEFPPQRDTYCSVAVLETAVFLLSLCLPCLVFLFWKCPTAPEKCWNLREFDEPGLGRLFVMAVSFFPACVVRTQIHTQSRSESVAERIEVSGKSKHVSVDRLSNLVQRCFECGDEFPFRESQISS